MTFNARQYQSSEYPFPSLHRERKTSSRKRNASVRNQDMAPLASAAKRSSGIADKSIHAANGKCTKKITETFKVGCRNCKQLCKIKFNATEVHGMCNTFWISSKETLDLLLFSLQTHVGKDSSESSRDSSRQCKRRSTHYVQDLQV